MEARQYTDIVGEHIDDKQDVAIESYYDCLIIGGGIAGISAALAASRHGCKTLIIEKSIMLGGLATLGFVNKYLPLCDGHGTKVCSGIAEELLYESIRYGYNSLPSEWRTNNVDCSTQSRYMSIFSPFDFAMAIDELIERENIDVLYDTVFVKPYLVGSSCKAVIVESKRGRHAFASQMVVDCTGDADVMYRCQVECELQGNWLSFWAYLTSFESMSQALDKKSMLQGVELWEKGAAYNGEGSMNSVPDYFLVTPEEITRFVTDGRRLLRRHMKESSNTGLIISALPMMAQMRTTRRIQGVYELTTKDLNKNQERSIGCATDWRYRGQIYEIPYDTLICDKIENVLTAGRSISATGDSWEVTRAIPACAVTGQAAGTAAAMAIRENCRVQDVEIRNLQRQLESERVILHMPQIYRG